MTTSSSLKLALHVMPSDQARADAALAAGQRLQAVGNALWRGLAAMGEARARRAAPEVMRRLSALSSVQR
jgi:hypothetical protein